MSRPPSGRCATVTGDADGCELTRRYAADARVNLLQGDEGRIRSFARDARLEVLLGGISSGPYSSCLIRRVLRLRCSVALPALEPRVFVSHPPSLFLVFVCSLAHPLSARRMWRRAGLHLLNPAAPPRAAQHGVRRPDTGAARGPAQHIPLAGLRVVNSPKARGCDSRARTENQLRGSGEP